jgi:hypothetical protein
MKTIPPQREIFQDAVNLRTTATVANPVANIPLSINKLYATIGPTKLAKITPGINNKLEVK